MINLKIAQNSNMVKTWNILKCTQISNEFCKVLKKKIHKDFDVCEKKIEENSGQQ